MRLFYIICACFFLTIPAKVAAEEEHSEKQSDPSTIIKIIDAEGDPILEKNDYFLEESKESTSAILKTKEALDFGIGLGGPAISGEENIGLDFLMGAEWLSTGSWRLGAHFHLLSASMFTNRSFSSLGVFATARPEHKLLRWLQFKAGVVSDRSEKSIEIVTNNPYTVQHQTVSWSGNGAAVGIGIVGESKNLIFHILDIERHFVAGHDFVTYGVSFLVLLEMH